MEPEIVEFLKKKGNYDFQFGARDILKNMEDYINVPIAQKILKEKPAKHDEMVLSIDEGQLQILINRKQSSSPDPKS